MRLARTDSSIHPYSRIRRMDGSWRREVQTLLLFATTAESRHVTTRTRSSTSPCSRSRRLDVLDHSEATQGSAVRLLALFSFLFCLRITTRWSGDNLRPIRTLAHPCSRIWTVLEWVHTSRMTSARAFHSANPPSLKNLDSLGRGSLPYAWSH